VSLLLQPRAAAAVLTPGTPDKMTPFCLFEILRQCDIFMTSHE
jgi:hypothetical protein